MKTRLAAAAVLLSSLALAAPPAIQGKEGEVALFTPDGKEVRLKQYGKKVTVLAYWGTFCGPCVDELPEVEKLFQKYKKDRDVAVLAISVDPVKTPEDRAAIHAFVKKLGLTMPVLVDKGPLAKRLLEDTSGGGAPRELALPMLAVIDPAFHVYREFGWSGAAGFQEKKVALIEAARKGQLPAEPPPPGMPTGGFTGPVTVSMKKMTPEQIATSEPQFKAQLAKLFPGASEADLAPLLDQMKQAALVGGKVELLPPGIAPERIKAIKLGQQADRLAQGGNPKDALSLYQQAWDGGVRDPGLLYNAACAAALSGDEELSLEWLSRAASVGFMDSKWARKDSDLDAVKSDPRFEELMKQFDANADKQLAAENAKEPKLQKELLALVEEDQEARRAQVAGEKGALERMQAIDKKSTARMKELLKQYGWPGKTLVGQKAAHGAWLLVQHADADPAFQKQCLPLIEAAVKQGEASGIDYAYLVDRVLVADGKPQRFGTQFHMEGGALVPRPMEDPDHVDDRRRAIGLGTMAEYKEQMRQTYGAALQRQDAGVK